MAAVRMAWCGSARCGSARCGSARRGCEVRGWTRCGWARCGCEVRVGEVRLEVRLGEIRGESRGGRSEVPGPASNNSDAAMVVGGVRASCGSARCGEVRWARC